MHLAPPQVTDYVLDGVVSTTSAPADKFPHFSHSNDGKVGNTFMNLCARDRSCSPRFKKPHTLASTLHPVLDKFDNYPNSTCAAIIDLGVEASASSNLRVFLSMLLPDSVMRKATPPLVYGLKSCEPKDIDVLNYFFTRYAESIGDEGPFFSELLYYLIVFSELWERPQPSMAEMTKRFTEFGISAEANPIPPLYCAFSKEKSKKCNKLKLGNYDAHGIIFKRDEYWNVNATIPSQASVLSLSSKLDAQTPHKYAKQLLESLDGGNRVLITFDYSIHGALFWTQLDEETPLSETCGMKTLGSYVKSKGDLSSLDKSCLDEIPGFLQIDYQNAYFGTDDAYDGIINSSSGSS